MRGWPTTAPGQPTLSWQFRNRASGRQTVTLLALQEVALCHGWVDTQTKHIDEARYAIRFVPRRPRAHMVREEARRPNAHGDLHDPVGEPGYRRAAMLPL